MFSCFKILNIFRLNLSLLVIFTDIYFGKITIYKWSAGNYPWLMYMYQISLDQTGIRLIYITYMHQKCHSQNYLCTKYHSIRLVSDWYISLICTKNVTHRTICINISRGNSLKKYQENKHVFLLSENLCKCISVPVFAAASWSSHALVGGAWTWEKASVYTYRKMFWALGGKWKATRQSLEI